MDYCEHVYWSRGFIGVCVLFGCHFSWFTHRLRCICPLFDIHSGKFDWCKRICKCKQFTCNHQTCDSRILRCVWRFPREHRQFYSLRSAIKRSTIWYFLHFLLLWVFARFAVVAEEIKDTKRNVPRAMFLSLGISMGVFVLVGLIAVGLLGPIGFANSPSPLSTAMATKVIRWLYKSLQSGDWWQRQVFF